MCLNVFEFKLMWRYNASQVWSNLKKLKFSVHKIITAICVGEFPEKISFDVFLLTFSVLGKILTQ